MKSASLNEYIQKIIEGDKNAFGTLMDMYADYVYKLAFQIMQNEKDAEDIVQETFIKIWKHIKNYNSNIKFTTWAYKITVNLCFDHLRKRKRRRTLEDEAGRLIGSVIFRNDSVQQLNNKEVRTILADLSKNLSDKQRTVFILQDIQELEPTEIEMITGMTKGQIKSNLYYARKQIKEQLKSIGYEL